MSKPFEDFPENAHEDIRLPVRGDNYPPRRNRVPFHVLPPLEEYSVIPLESVVNGTASDVCLNLSKIFLKRRTKIFGFLYGIKITPGASTCLPFYPTRT